MSVLFCGAHRALLVSSPGDSMRAHGGDRTAQDGPVVRWCRALRPPHFMKCKPAPPPSVPGNGAHQRANKASGIIYRVAFLKPPSGCSPWGCIGLFG